MKYFDMGSNNNFNALSWWFDKEEKKPVWPPWLSLPVHYQELKKSWTYLRDVTFEPYRPDVAVLHLGCGHRAYTSIVKFQNITKYQLNRIRVNCTDCGGKGEISYE